MAKITQLIDDLDSSPIDEEQEGAGTLVFAIGDEFYSIDLGAKNRAAFDKAVSKYVEHATAIDNPYAQAPAPRPGRGAVSVRRVQVASPGRGGSASGYGKEELAMAREWLRANGHEVSDRGRVKAELLELWEANQPR